MLLGINLLLLLKVNAARHNLQLLVNLQALVDGKKIIITEATVRRDLQLEDAEGIDCLPNANIFEQFTIMGAKTTAWNEFSSTMASVIICLATNQKFNFSKYIFESMVKNLDNAGKFLMYPRFVQVFLDNQLEGMATHNRTYIAPSYTKKIFANMRRQGKDFSGRVTPLFPTMMVQGQEEMGEGLEMPTDPHHTPIITQHSSSQPQRKQKYRRSKRKDAEAPQPSDSTHVADEDVNEEPKITLVDETQGRHDDDLMFNTCVLNDEEVFAGHDMAEKEVSIADPVTTTGEVVTTANVAVSTACTIPVSAATITEDEITLAQTLELRLVREKGEANIALTEEWNNIQAKIKTDYELAQRLQAEEQEELTFDEKATLFQ
ncbi:hypothetical protein Tco_0820642 [Tanacetum coccineum]|uniref:Uncharacterized protein n=1 Tax=Tanacetum coccineum TaxID=301880 RepID=A0ABQ5AE31_9ASTR